MDWTNAVEEIFQKYSGQSGATATASEDPHGDFQQVARAAPPAVVADGLSQAFHSDQTPPFSEMVGKLFGQSDPNQKAGLLNRLLSSLGPSGIGGLPALGTLAGLLAGQPVSPEHASQISPNQVQQIAAQAEQKNPSIVDDVSNFYAQHPQVIKAIGGMAVTIALQHMLKR